MRIIGLDHGLRHTGWGIIELKNKEKDLGKRYFNTKLDNSIDISITPNRADCIGVRGIARDLSS